MGKEFGRESDGSPSVSHECISRAYLTSVASEGHEHYE